MLEKEFEKLNKAYREYNLEEREEVSMKILNYIQDRLIKNKEDIEKISGIFKDISFERIMEIYLEEVSKPEIYKKQKTLKKLDNDFVYEKDIYFNLFIFFNYNSIICFCFFIFVNNTIHII